MLLSGFFPILELLNPAAVGQITLIYEHDLTTFVYGVVQTSLQYCASTKEQV